MLKLENQKQICTVMFQLKIAVPITYIVNCFVHEFQAMGIDLAKCTSLASDGAASMMGKHKGVGKQMQSKYSPYCIAHRLNLACTDSIKKNKSAAGIA